MKPRLALTLAVALAVAGSSSRAQESGAPPPEAAPVEETAPPVRAVEEIFVTAQKKEQSVEEVPISISAFTGDFLKDVGIDDLHELAEFAPNVRITNNPCCTTVFIRGFGTPFAASAFDPTVGLALDELSIPKEIYMSDPVFDIERFEVLRGPQGTLFGKNTPAGLFNVTTGNPTRELSGYVLGKIGGLDLHRVEAAIGAPLGPLGEFAQLRLAAVDLHGVGDVENTKLRLREPAPKQQAGRLKLAIQPLDALDVLLIAERAETESRFFHVQQHDLRDSSVEFLRRFDPRFEDDGLNHQNSINLKDDLSRETDRLQANVRYGWDELFGIKNAEVVAVLGDTGFLQDAALDVDWSPADAVNLVSPTIFDYDQRSAELRLSGFVPAPFDFGELEFLAGVLVFDGDFRSSSPLRAGADFDEYLVSAPGFELITGNEPPGGVGFEDVNAALAALGQDPIADAAALEGDGARFFLDQDTGSQAGFGQVSWHPTDQWIVSFGGRLTHETKDALLVNECFDPGVLCGALGIEEFVLNLDRSETEFSPKGTVQYFPLEELALFATYGQGFKSGGFNNFSFKADAIQVEPEKTASWETGAKGTVLDRALSYSATFFHMDVDDLQLQNLTGGVVVTRNAASARSTGVEADFRWLTPWEPLSFFGSGTFTDARFKDFPNAPATAPSGAEEQDLSGRRLPFSPQWQFNVTPQLDFPFALPFAMEILPRDFVLTTAFDVLFRTNMYLDNDLDPHTRQDKYAKANGRIGISTADKTLSFTTGVDNLTDTEAFELQIDSLLYPGGYMGLQEFQRNYWFELRYAW